MPNRPVRPRVLAFLEQQAGFVHVGGIARGAQVSTPTVRKVLAQLKTEGRLEIGTVPADVTGDQRRTGWPGYRLKQDPAIAGDGRFEAELRQAATEEDRDEAYRGIHRIAAAANIAGETYQANSIGEVCDMLAEWCTAQRARRAALRAAIADNPQAPRSDLLVLLDGTDYTRAHEPGLTALYPRGATIELPAGEAVAAGQAVEEHPPGQVRPLRHGDWRRIAGTATNSAAAGDQVRIIIGGRA